MRPSFGVRPFWLRPSGGNRDLGGGSHSPAGTLAVHPRSQARPSLGAEQCWPLRGPFTLHPSGPPGPPYAPGEGPSQAGRLQGCKAPRELCHRPGYLLFLLPTTFLGSVYTCGRPQITGTNSGLYAQSFQSNSLKHFLQSATEPLCSPASLASPAQSPRLGPLLLMPTCRCAQDSGLGPLLFPVCTHSTWSQRASTSRGSEGSILGP